MDQRSNTWNFLLECQCNLHRAGWAVREGILQSFEAELRSLRVEEELAWRFQNADPFRIPDTLGGPHWGPCTCLLQGSLANSHFPISSQTKMLRSRIFSFFEAKPHLVANPARAPMKLSIIFISLLLLLLSFTTKFWVWLITDDTPDSDADSRK